MEPVRVLFPNEAGVSYYDVKVPFRESEMSNQNRILVTNKLKVICSKEMFCRMESSKL